MKKTIYLILGIASLILASIGIVLPILPTTPLLLLSAWLFLRSSDKLYCWLLNHKIFGIYIKSYLKYRGVERRYKVFAIIMVWISITFSIYVVEYLYLKLLLLTIMIGVTIHILSLRTLKKEEMIALEKFEKEERDKNNNNENYKLRNNEN